MEQLDDIVKRNLATVALAKTEQKFPMHVLMNTILYLKEIKTLKGNGAAGIKMP
jgi:hypothetical protein